MSEKRYIHIRNWDSFQHADVTRNKRSPAGWIKDATGQLSDEDYLALSFADRGLLQSLRLQYALTRGRGIDEHTGSLQRVLGQRVVKTQLERLNDAGFIEFSASKDACNMQADTLANSRKVTRLDADADREGEEDQEQEPLLPPSVAKGAVENGRTEGDETIRRTIEQTLTKITVPDDDDDIPF